MTDEDALKILVALGDPRRFEMYRKVADAPGLSSSELKSGKAASTTSHHLKLLVDAGIFEATKDGKHVRHSVQSGTLKSFARWAARQAELSVLDDLTKYLSDNPA